MSKFHDKPNIYVTDLVLKVDDLKRSTEFYEKIMGFKILSETDNSIVFTVDGVTPIIKIIQPDNVIEKLPRRTGLYHFALLLPNRLQLGLFLKNIRNLGYPIRGGSHHGVSEAIYLEDPDDNGIEVYADVDSKSWRWEGDTVDMVTLPLDYDNLIEETKDLQWEGAPSGAIIGHIHLHVSDLEESKKFYIDGLGFDVVMDIARSALFISSGGYHHHIGLNIWNGRGAQPLPENSVGMKYYTLTFPDIQTRQDTIDNLKRLGFSIIEEGNEIFTKDPSENLIKFVV